MKEKKLSDNHLAEAVKKVTEALEKASGKGWQVIELLPPDYKPRVMSRDETHD